MIIDEPVLKFRGDPYHPYHFHCYSCKVELTADAREKNDELYCLRCHDKVMLKICQSLVSSHRATPPRFFPLSVTFPHF